MTAAFTFKPLFRQYVYFRSAENSVYIGAFREDGRLDAESVQLYLGKSA